MNAENAALMERGQDLLKSGDIASARLLFQRLANAGIADAALALAATYDPRYLAQHNLIGVVGDETKAHDWYQRASELGSIEAATSWQEQMPTNSRSGSPPFDTMHRATLREMRGIQSIQIKRHGKRETLHALRQACAKVARPLSAR